MAYHHLHSEFSPFVFWGVSEQCVIRLEKRPKIFNFFYTETSAKKCPILIKSFIWTGPQHHITIIIHTEAKGGTATNQRWQYIECKHLFTIMSAVCLQIISCLFTILLTHFDSKEGYQSGFSSIVIFLRSLENFAVNFSREIRANNACVLFTSCHWRFCDFALENSTRHCFSYALKMQCNICEIGAFFLVIPMSNCT